MIRVQPLWVILVLMLAGPMVLGQRRFPRLAGEGLLRGEYANSTIAALLRVTPGPCMTCCSIRKLEPTKRRMSGMLVDEEATRKNIMSALNSWLGNRVREEDSILNSGHGALGNWRTRPALASAMPC